MRGFISKTSKVFGSPSLYSDMNQYVATGAPVRGFDWGLGKIADEEFRRRTDLIVVDISVTCEQISCYNVRVAVPIWKWL